MNATNNKTMIQRIRDEVGKGYRNRGAYYPYFDFLGNLCLLMGSLEMMGSLILPSSLIPSME